eukprot:3155484-Amphidinium_carterae.1
MIAVIVSLAIAVRSTSILGNISAGEVCEGRYPLFSLRVASSVMNIGTSCQEYGAGFGTGDG